jgi:outer membrane protein
LKQKNRKLGEYMKRNFLVALLATFSIALARAEVKVGFVDLQKAIQSTSAGKKAKAELEGEFNKRKKEFEKQDADIKKAGEDLVKKKAVMTEEAFAKKQSELQDEMLKFREAVGQSQFEIQKKQQDLTTPILEKIRKTISKIAKEKGYTMVAESGTGILYSEPNADLTEEVIKSFESDK